MSTNLDKFLKPWEYFVFCVENIMEIHSQTILSLKEIKNIIY